MLLKALWDQEQWFVFAKHALAWTQNLEEGWLLGEQLLVICFLFWCLKDIIVKILWIFWIFCYYFVYIWNSKYTVYSWDKEIFMEAKIKRVYYYQEFSKGCISKRKKIISKECLRCKKECWVHKLVKMSK